MKVPLEIAEAVLNHVSGTMSGVASTYWLYTFAAEKEVALNKWGTKIEKILVAHKIEYIL